MKSSTKKFKILSAATLAVSSLFATNAAHAASLSLYYGQTPGSNAETADDIYVGTGITSSNTPSLIGGVPQTVSQITPTTITMPVAGYLSISINALLTGDTNPDAGKAEVSTSGSTFKQPNTLGLAALGIKIPVSANDANGSILQPLGVGSPIGNFTNNNGQPGYNTTALINQSQAVPGGSQVPKWIAARESGDMAPDDGSVGVNFQIFGGNSPEAFYMNAAGLNRIQQFSAPSASYSNSTEFFSNLIYQAAGPGDVTLSPFVDTSATQYWSVLVPAADPINGVYQNDTNYRVDFFGANDTIGTLTPLVIDVRNFNAHPVVQLSSQPEYGPDLGSLTANSPYINASVLGLSESVTDCAQINDWNPGQPQSYALDLLVNGLQANPFQLSTLIAAIDGDGIAPASLGVTASTTAPGPVSPYGNFTYNLYLTFPASGPSPTDFLDFDLSTFNDFNLQGYSFNAVAVVLPEPMSLSLLAAGAVGFLSRRHRRSNITTNRTLFPDPNHIPPPKQP